ncbi:Ubiquinone biosynthesis accessory factor UbiK [Gammaproteobacteria bacterium]
MFDPKTLDDLTTRLTSMLPTGALEFQRDLEKNLRAVLSSAFARLDLVTREEFEIQKALLERTQDRVAALARQVEALTAQGAKTSPSTDDAGQDEL